VAVAAEVGYESVQSAAKALKGDEAEDESGDGEDWKEVIEEKYEP
jgi:hypothetical protein